MQLRIGSAIAAILCANAARAGEPLHAHAALDYVVPPELSACPDRESFVSAVATRLGYDPFANGSGAPQTLVVRFRRDQSAVIADLRLLRSANEERARKSLVSESGACDELGSASAFAAAVLVDPRAIFPRPVKPPGGTPLDSKSPGTWPWYEPPPTLPPPPKPLPPGESLRGRAGVVAVGCAGCAPSPNLGAAVFVGVSKGRLGIDLGARADLPTATSSSGREVSSALVLGEVFPHARLGPALAGVLGVAGGLLGDGAGEKRLSPWTAVGARVAFEWPIGAAVFVHAAVEGVLVVSRVSLRVDGREVWSTPAFVIATSLGAGMRF